MTREQIEARIAELEAENEAATGWGAAVGARHEEIKGLKRQLDADLPTAADVRGILRGSSAANGEAAIARAAREATLANRLYRSDGDLWTDAPINLSKFVRFLALQPHVLPDDAQGSRVWHRTNCHFCGSPDGQYSASVRELSAAFFCNGCGINKPASQPSPAAPVETEVRGQAHRDAISPSGGKMFNAHNGSSAANEPVAWTNEAQLGFLKDPNYALIPMAMWAERADKYADVPLYRAVPQASAASEPVTFINTRLADLAEANTLYGKDQRLGAPDKIARNDREISWLKELRSIIVTEPQGARK